MTSVVFDARAVRRNRARAARAPAGASFLFEEIASRLVERLDEVRGVFPTALEIGARGDIVRRALAGRGGIQTLIHMEAAPALLPRDGARVVAEAETLPFGPASRLDLVVSNLALHWVNDLPGALLQIRQALRPDGLFLAAVLGGETLRELGEALTHAELETRGGAAPRLSPSLDVPALGGLLQRAGFALPVIDTDTLTFTYGDAIQLMRELRAMGEANAHVERLRRFTPRATLLRAAALYAERFADTDGRIPATFQVIYLTAWTPAPSQPKPLRRGSATHRLGDALGARERPAGDDVPQK